MPTPKVGLFGTSVVGRVENPENQPTSKGCKNRANWWILMKPMSNERSRINFSRFFGIFDFYWFLNVLHLFEHGPDPDFRKLLKIPKIGGFWARTCGIQMIFFKIFFATFFFVSSSRFCTEGFLLTATVQKMYIFL